MFTLTICTVHPARKLAQTGKKNYMGPNFVFTLLEMLLIRTIFTS